MTVKDKRVLLGITGSIAAYKSVEVARLLLKQGLELDVVMTTSAERFVGAATFSGITGRTPHTEMFSAPGELHVRLARACEKLLIVPATADTLARLAQGRSDDLLGATALCFSGPRFVAPAMHPAMWRHPATQRNVAQLKQDGYQFIGPETGEVASGDHGIGRLTEPAQIVEQLLQPSGDLVGRHVVITAGPTVEDIDPVRFLSNRSSGKMGFALAARAAARGARVELVAGPVALPTPPGVRRHDVRSARELLETLRDVMQPSVDALFMAAAVGDYRAANPSKHKLKRDGAMQLDLAENPDVIATIASELKTRRPHPPLLVAFALETGSDEQVRAEARAKRVRKQVDYVVANAAHEALGTDDNRIMLVGGEEHPAWPTMSKSQVADRLLTELLLSLPNQ